MWKSENFGEQIGGSRVGRFSLEVGHRYPQHLHTGGREAISVISGRLGVIIGGGEEAVDYILEPGKMVIVEPNQAHLVYNVGADPVEGYAFMVITQIGGKTEVLE